MDRETAKQEVKMREPDFLPKAREKSGGHFTYICPSCGNGSGSSGTGIALDPHSPRARRYKCFVCGLSEDVIGLWKLHNGITDNGEAFRTLYDYYGIQVDGFQKPSAQEDFSPENQNRSGNERYTHTQEDIHTQTYTQQPKQKNNYMQYYRECMGRVSELDYPQKRGLSKDVVENFMLGYDPHFKVKGGEWKALIIPTSPSSFVARNTDPDATKGERYRKTGPALNYNTKTLTGATGPIVVVEGELDALAIITVGGEAVALGSTANYGQFVKRLEEKKPTQPLVIALDNDADGESTAGKLIMELERLGVSFYRANLYGECKDAGEAIVKDREAFSRAVESISDLAREEERERLEEQKREYMENSVASHLQEFVDGIADSVNTPYYPTGFPRLDGILDGGLYEGLITVGAISSLGKTSLVLQLCDQVAMRGNDVLIFSLEMSRAELMAKSISRLTMLEVLAQGGNMADAKTARGITTGTRYRYYTDTERNLINRSIEAYGEYAGHLYITEGIGNVGTQDIKDMVERHILFTGRRPLVVIDYLQILAPAPEDLRASDKQITDRNITKLKQISRDFKVPIIGISSFNRANYNVAVSMEAFKESGSVEYSSDILIGLQLKGAGGKNFDVNEAKSKDPREVELVILKNRNGATGGKVQYNYYPKFNYFEEA